MSEQQYETGKGWVTMHDDIIGIALEYLLKKINVIVKSVSI